MPQSTNAPFNEFGQSMILRDIEDLYMLIGGSGTGAAGDGQTQDQSVAESQGVLQDKIGSPVVTEATAPQVIAANIPNPLPISQGGTSAQTTVAALAALRATFATQTTFTSNGSFTATYSGRVGLITQMAFIGTQWFVATTSGTLPTTPFKLLQSGGGGGGGSVIWATFDVVAGESYTVVVGAAGSVDNDGGETSVKDTATSGTVVDLRARGGQRGDSSSGLWNGLGGSVYGLIDASRRPFYVGNIGAKGVPGSLATGGITNSLGAPSVSLYGLNGGGGGIGANSSGTGAAAGTAGAVILLTQ